MFSGNNLKMGVNHLVFELGGHITNISYRTLQYCRMLVKLEKKSQYLDFS